MCRAGPAYTPSLGRLDVVYEVLEAEPDALPLAGGSLNGVMTTYKARRLPGQSLPCQAGGEGRRCIHQSAACWALVYAAHRLERPYAAHTSRASTHTLCGRG